MIFSLKLFLSEDIGFSYLFTVIVLQPPFNEVTYTIIGDGPATRLFRIDENGAITVNESLNINNSPNRYTVSINIYIVWICDLN